MATETKTPKKRKGAKASVAANGHVAPGEVAIAPEPATTPVPGAAPRPGTEIPTSLRERQRTLKSAFRIYGDLAKQVITVRSVTPADARDGRVRIAIDGAAGVELEIGAHASVGGPEDIACPDDYFLASLAACYEITLRLVAASSRIAINRLDLRVEGDWDARGTLGLDPDVPVGITGIRVLVDLDADGPEDRLAKLPELVERYCVVSQTLKHPPKIEIRHA